jgi:hypothetical protein
MSVNETGHARNVAKFGELGTKVAGFGPEYNPPVPELKSSALDATKAVLDTALENVAVEATKHKNAVNTRQYAFEAIGHLGMRIVGALIAFGASKKTIDDAKSILRKILGRRKSPKVNPEDNTTPQDGEKSAGDDGDLSGKVKSISASQMSYDNRKANFMLLIDFVSAEPTYQPNEDDLKISSLKATLENLGTVNTNVNVTADGLENARIARNKLLYDLKTGAIYIAARVKEYVKGLYGPDSVQYKDVKKIVFTKPSTK